MSEKKSILNIGDKIRVMQNYTNKTKGINEAKWSEWHIVDKWNFRNLNDAIKSQQYELIKGYKDGLQ